MGLNRRRWIYVMDASVPNNYRREQMDLMIGYRLDLRGREFSKLTAVVFAGKTPAGQAKWWVECSCGEYLIVRANDLRTGRTRSCGCLRRERSRELKTTHGHARYRRFSGVYKAWRAMVQRCEIGPESNAYQYYAGRGISVCHQWRNSFETFFADMGPRPFGKTLDRINNDGNYEPGNCRWATMGEQRRNSRPRRRIDESIKAA